jgi:thiol-disulfide isomerase/thioredoxin
MKKLFLAAAMLLSASAFAQSSDYEISKDDENGAVVFKGQLSFEDLKKEPTFEWMAKGAAAYRPSENDISYLQDYLPKYELVVLLGTWCEDSQRLIPELYKILQAAKYPMASLKMYGVNRAKETKNIEHKLYRIERVPTIILFKDHTEVGRIVENVKQTMEGDLVALISNDMSNAAEEKK